MARFKYFPGNSFFHKMDPTMKFVWVFTVIIAVIANFEIVYGAAWYLYVLFLVFVAAKVSIKEYLKSVVFFFGLAMFIVVWQAIYYPTFPRTIIFEWGPIMMTIEGLKEGISIFFRIMVIVSLSVVFTMTTDPERMVGSLVQIGKIPYRYGYVAYNAIKLIPLYENEFIIIQNAHQIRGVGGQGKNVFSRLRIYFSLLVPLLVGGLRRAQASAIAMDSRAFGAYAKRTILNEMKISLIEKIFVILHILVLAGVVYYFIILGHGLTHHG